VTQSQEERRSVPSGPAPTVRAVVRVSPIDRATARGRAPVPGSIDPRLRSAPPWVPPPRPQPPAVVSPQPGPAPEPDPTSHPEPPPDPTPERQPAPPPPPEPDPVPDERQSAGRPVSNPDVGPRSERRKPRITRALVPLAAALIAAFVGGTGYLMVREPAAIDDAGRWSGSTPVATSSPDAAPFAVAADGTGADPFGTRGPALTGVPTRLKVDAIDVDTSLEALRIGGDGGLQPPADFAKAGWYADGTRPGDIGPAVIAGHVDSYRGPAVFHRLRELRPGDTVEVRRGEQWLPFRVVATGHYPKNKFPTARVYGATPGAELRLITCGGEFDRGKRSYRDNVVVYAVDARVPDLPLSKGDGPMQWQ
jgi:outer membrane biosynthesis protein TonB